MKYYLLLLSISFSSISIAQESLPIFDTYYDLSGENLSTYYSSLYLPKKVISNSYKVGNNYTKGKYYDNDGNKIEGLLNYNQRNNNFKFKPEEDKNQHTFGKTIKPTFCSKYTIGLDSFITITNFSIERGLGSFPTQKLQFAQVLDETDSKCFLKHLHMNQNRVLATYIINKPGESLKSIAKGGLKLQKDLLEHFGDISGIKTYLENNTILHDQIEELISIYIEIHKSLKQEYIYYDINWNRIESSKNAKYYAVADFNDFSNIKYDYYHIDHTLIYSGSYNFNLPLEKNGFFKWYFPNGKLWREEEYSKDEKVNDEKKYYENGQLHSVINSFGFNNLQLYKELYTNKGVSVLDSKNSGIEQYYDKTRNCIIYNEYKGGILISSYYLKDDIKIYTKCSKPAKLITHHTNYFQHHEDYPMNESDDFQNWNSLVKFIINPKGEFISYEIISMKNELFDSYTNSYIESMAKIRLFKKAKHHKEKVFQEVVVPFVFNIQGYKRTRNSYNWYWMHNNFNSTPIHIPKFNPMTF